MQQARKPGLIKVLVIDVFSKLLCYTGAEYGVIPVLLEKC